MKKISQLFLQGLLAALPIIITGYIIYWSGSLAETMLGKAIQFILPATWYIPGMGILAGFGVLLAIGVLLKAYLFRQLAELFERLLEKIPFVKTVYKGVRDIAKFVSSKNTEDLQRTVLLSLDDNIDNNIKVLGFVTRRNLSLGKNDNLLAVYVPMSYQIGGFTLLVPESRVEPIDIDTQSAMRFIVTAGMIEPQQNDPQNGHKK
jgi:uncharacterized membrane protein